MRAALLLAAAAAPLGGCFGDDRGNSPDAPMRVDGRPGEPDARIDGRPGEPDARPDAMPTGGHLLLSEVRTAGADEFIEIVNPTSATVALADYYLTDVPGYWQLPGHAAGNLVLSPTLSDFVVRFPAGASLAPGEVIVVAMDGAAYALSFGAPDYTVEEPTAGATPMASTGVTNPIGATLTNSGEAVILFRWDGTSDRVQDVDIVIAGNAPDAANTIGAKAAVDGPDGDAAPTAYAADALTLDDMASDADDVGGVKRTYKRIAAETGNETATGGNGVAGHDETSEQLRATWDSSPTASGYSAATPGTVPAF